MEEGNVINRIRKAAWIAERLADEAEELLDKARDLSAEERRALPKVTGLWKEREIRNYLERLKEALKEPRLFHSRQLLEEVGFSSEGISTNMLDETEEIRKVANFLRELEEIDGTSQVMKDARVLPQWLNEGIPTTVAKLKAIIEAKEGFKRLLNLENVHEEIKEEFVKMAFENPVAIQQAEELDSQIACIGGHGIDVMYHNEGLQSFLEVCKAVYESLTELENTYKLPTQEVERWTAGKSLLEANTLLRSKVEQVKREHAELLRQWRELAQTLQLLGQEVPHLPPQGIPGLKEGVDDLESKCKGNLGESGQELLNFLRGKFDFPDRLSKSEIREALERLRPFIIKSLGGIEWLE